MFAVSPVTLKVCSLVSCKDKLLGSDVFHHSSMYLTTGVLDNLGGFHDKTIDLLVTSVVFSSSGTVGAVELDNNHYINYP